MFRKYAILRMRRGVGGVLDFIRIRLSYQLFYFILMDKSINRHLGP